MRLSFKFEIKKSEPKVDVILDGRINIFGFNK